VEQLFARGEAPCRTWAAATITTRCAPRVGDEGDDVLDGTAGAIARESVIDASASQILEGRGGDDRLTASAPAVIAVEASAVASNTLGAGTATISWRLLPRQGPLQEIPLLSSLPMC
jgi:hypothetical protein